MPIVDKEKRKEYNRQQYLKNKEKYKCEHGRQKSICRDCGGCGICEHGREKSKCRECGGSQICEHDRQKSQCRDCGGSQICEHDRQKSKCRDCGGSQICQHGRLKSQCRDCGGSRICEHNRIKSTCRDCGGSQICEHERRKSKCRDCGGGSICEHGRRKSECRYCSPYLYQIQLQRRSINRIMRQTNIEKTKPSIEYLGCSVEYFHNYIKSKMTEGMTFDNIHYDHIKPVASFNLEDEDELLNCCHYTNFQPLLAKDNLCKNCKWSDEDEVFWKENICGKEYIPLYFPK